LRNREGACQAGDIRVRSRTDGAAGRRAEEFGSIRQMTPAKISADAAPAPWRAWLMVALLFMFMFLNYADKNVIGLAGPQIRQDLNLSYTAFGDIGSSFFYLFAISSIIGGFVANRLPSRWLLLAMGLIWSATQFPMMGTVGIGTLITCRVLLGAGEGPAYPVALHATYKWFADDRRTLPTSLLVLGAGVGTAVSGLILPAVIQRWDWHAAFVTVGLAGLVWSLAWFLLGREGPIEDHAGPAAAGERVPYRHLVTCPTMIGIFIACFGAYWSIAVGIVWGYSYMIQAAHLDPLWAGRVSVIPTVISILLAPAIGWLSQRLLQGGMSTRVCRGVLGCAGLLLGAVGIVGMALMEGTWQKLAFYSFAASITFVIFTVGPPIIAEITPGRQRGAMLAINNAIYSSAGILAPSIMGRVVDAAPDPLTGYRNGYLLLAAILAGCGLLGLVLIDPQRERRRLAARRSSGLAVSRPSLAE
jgi:ACS family D-galactonate transporter-like MFS transporter